ncbi:MAG: diguanylate cyclase [Burkholderiaceae bacterium]
MHRDIAGYRLDAELHQGQTSVVYRGVRLRDGAAVVIKILKNEFPTTQETARYEREFRIAGSLQAAHCVRALELTLAGHRSMLVYEDDGCVSLDRLYGGRALDLATFLRVAIAATQALAEVHACRLIHGDVNPGNLLIHPVSGNVKLTDFELARDQDAPPDHATAAVGTLAYMAPEQSGRANLRADCRADLYSLGASLFELACGRPVFADLDEVSLLHAHFALTPPLIHELNAEFPAVLDAIVQKLLAKMPADRYQSAQGLLSDLEQVQRKWQANESLDTLVPGQSDHTLRLKNLDRMIGCEHLLAALHAGRDEALHGDRPIWLRLRGAAGAGKSTLVARFAESLPAGNVLLSGGGEAQAQSIPYAALIAAFDCLLRHWLATSEADIAAIRVDLQRGAGVNLSVLEPLLPRLSSIVGALAASASPGAGAEQARFLAALRAFMQVAAARQQPLIFFIDDLQWVDAASLLLIESLLLSELTPCLLVTAERRDVVSPALAAMFERLDAVSISGSVHDLQPLSRSQLGELLDGTLGDLEGGVAARAALIDILQTKTLGNPFFARQLLDNLVRHGALTANRSKHGECWRFDAKHAQSLAVADNVLALLGAHIESLANPLRSVLEHAACIGQPFDLATLTSILPAAIREQLPELLQELVSAGMLQATDDPASGRFIHERIREAVLSEAMQTSREAIHLAIGRLWNEQPERSVFDTTSQFNLGTARIRDDIERQQAALLNARAARVARAQTAYDASLEYAENALRLLPTAMAQEQPAKARELQVLLADAQASAGQLDASISTFDSALQLAQTDDERAHVLERLCDALQASGRPVEALVQVQRALAMLGHTLDLPGADAPAAQAVLQVELDQLLERLGSESALQSLTRLHAASEPEARISRLYDKAIISVYFSRPEMLGLVTARSIAHVLNTGLTPEAALAFGWWSMILCMHDRHALALQYARWVRTIHEHFRNDYYGGGGRMVAAAMTLSWMCPYAESFAEAGESARLLNLSGNMQFSSYGLITQHIITVAEAADCQAMLNTCERWAAYCARYVPLEFGQTRIRRYCIQRLLGLDPAPLDCEAIVQAYAAQNNATDVCESLTEMARYALLTDDFAGALSLAERAHPYFCAGAAGNLLLNFNHLVMLAIASARMARQARGDTHVRLVEQYDAVAARVAFLSTLQMQNFAAYNDLVRAEGALMHAQHDTALGAYFASIRHAQQHGYVLLQAQATQYLAEMLQEDGNHLAHSLRRDAEQLYRRANCLIKLAGSSNSRGTSGGTDTDGRGGRRGADLARGVDVLSLMKANEAITSEINYDRLLIRLLEITVENAGAQRGVLVLQEDGVFFVAGASGEDHLHEPLDHTTRCPVQMIHYVARSGLATVLESGQRRSTFRQDPYFEANDVRSVLAAPLVRQGSVRGVVYLENNAVDGAFGNDRLEAIRLLLGAAAIALENATLYRGQKRYADQLEARVRDRTLELEDANAALARLADLDALTQIANRRSFDRECLRYADDQADVTLLICDVDDFKSFNDHHGHPAGDGVLRRVAAAMTAVALPGIGLVARYGGEEFAVVLRDIGEAAAVQFATDLQRAIVELAIPHLHSRAAGWVTLSIGVARARRLSIERIPTLIADADKALYVAKQRGRNQVSLHADFHLVIEPAPTPPAS